MSDLPTVPPGQEIKRYCCGCTSRTSTIIAASFLSVAGSLYFAVGMFALTDTSDDAPSDDERVMFQMLLPAMALQVCVSALAIWGAWTYRGWPVQCARIWISILMVFNFIGMIISLNPVILVGLLVQLFFFWMPMYGYGKDYEQLKALANAGVSTIEYESSPLGEGEGDDGQAVDGVYLDDHHDDKEDDVELV